MPWGFCCDGPCALCKYQKTTSSTACDIDGPRRKKIILTSKEIRFWMLAESAWHFGVWCRKTTVISCWQKRPVFEDSYKPWINQRVSNLCLTILIQTEWQSDIIPENSPNSLNLKFTAVFVAISLGKEPLYSESSLRHQLRELNINLTTTTIYHVT